MHDNASLKQFLATSEMTEEELATVLSGYERVEFKKGSFILKEGQIAREYFFVEQGFLTSYLTDYEGNDITTAFHPSNELLINVVSFFLQKPSEENILALTDCVLWRTKIDIFYHHFNTIEHYSDWGRNWMVNNLFHHKTRSLSLVKKSAKDRYLELLNNHSEVFEYATLQQIASYLGITNTSLSRIRKEISTPS